MSRDYREYQHAPVLITTLNRIDHFKRCLESLERCTGAAETEVFVALDYPPSEKYFEGWKKIDKYLTLKESNNSFKKLNIIRRDRNYGVCHENGNFEVLIRDIKKNYNCYITSEDDNEFSPNFLEFINKGLFLYRDEDIITMISGYSYPEISEMHMVSNVVAFRKAAAWGAGFWTNKPFTYEIIGGERYRDKVLSSWKESMRLFTLRPISLNSLMSMKFRNAAYGDGLIIDCLLLENKYCVFPRISKVRNWGNDGSGVHSGDVAHYETQEIDLDDKFEYGELTFSKYMPFEKWEHGLILRVLFKLFMPSIVLFRYFCYRLSGKDAFGFYFERRIKKG